MEKITETIHKFKAIDGIIFDSETQCIRHEYMLNCTKIYILKSRSRHSNTSMGYFSSKENILEYARHQLTDMQNKSDEEILDELYIEEILVDALMCFKAPTTK